MFYDPFTEFDRLFDDAFFTRLRAPITSAEVHPTVRRHTPFRPRMDLFEAKDANTVTATFELPGLNITETRMALLHLILMSN